MDEGCFLFFYKFAGEFFTLFIDQGYKVHPGSQIADRYFLNRVGAYGTGHHETACQVAYRKRCQGSEIPGIYKNLPGSRVRIYRYAIFPFLFRRSKRVSNRIQGRIGHDRCIEIEENCGSILNLRSNGQVFLLFDGISHHGIAVHLILCFPNQVDVPECEFQYTRF